MPKQLQADRPLASVLIIVSTPILTQSELPYRGTDSQKNVYPSDTIQTKPKKDSPISDTWTTIATIVHVGKGGGDRRFLPRNAGRTKKTSNTQ